MASCDPSTLADQAKCFDSCVPEGMQNPLKTSLICSLLTRIAASEPQFVRSQTAGTTSNVATITVPAFNASGGNFLLVGVTWRNGPGLRAITSITANGVAMTCVDLILASAQNGRLAVYALASP